MSLKLLEDRIKTQQQNHEQQLSLMKNKIKTLELMRLFETTKYNQLLGVQERDGSIYKLILEQTQDELDDFKAWFDLLTKKEDCGFGDECGSLEERIKKLKENFEHLAFVKRSDVSTFLKETGFAWSLFKDMERGFSDRLMRKDEEIKKQDEIISRMMVEMEENGSKKRLRRSPRFNS